MTSPSPAERPRVAVILAAGKGTRMRSETPKVLHRAAGRPMLQWVVEAARGAGCERTVIIVGHGAEEVRQTVTGGGVEWVLQAEQRGTGHALAQVEDAVSDEAMLLVLSGDVPLVTAETLEGLAAAATDRWGAMAVAELDEPASLGRVVASPGGDLGRIVEAADASEEELAIRRINAGLYALPAPEIYSYLAALTPDNAKGELYLTDALGAAAADGKRLALFDLEEPAEAFGVNTRAELARAHRALLDRHLEALMDSGVTILEPGRTSIDPAAQIGPETVIHPGVTILGAAEVGAGCTLHQGVWLRDSRLGDGVIVEPYSVLDGARVEARCRVGPFARLRPGSRLSEETRVGNFVEIKNSHLGPGAKAGHLAYLGDATIGAGVVTCNFDGREKHATEIGAAAFVGSDTMLVAPVTLGEGAVTGAGSVITHDVPAGALAVERTRQRVVPGWADRRAGKRGERRTETQDAEDKEP